MRRRQIVKRLELWKRLRSSSRPREEALPDRDEIVRTALEHVHGRHATGKQHQSRGRPATERTVNLWKRLQAFASWETGVIVAGCALVLTVAPVAVVALTSGSGDPQAEASRPVSTAASFSRELVPTVTALPVIEPTATAAAVAPPASNPEAEPSPTPKPSPARTDCDEIRGTAYRSGAERDWFLANCLKQTLVLAGPPAEAPSTPEPTPTSPPPAPTAAPSPAPSTLPSSEAIALGADWWTANEAPLGYAVREGSCVASQTASLQWLISCEAELPGCRGLAACRLAFSVCLIEGPSTIWPC